MAGVLAFNLDSGVIVEIDLIADPRKLRNLSFAVLGN
jgi:hypothetical protein